MKNKKTVIRTAPLSPHIRRGGDSWVYTDIVRDHFFNPRNLLKPEDEREYKADGVGQVGSPACGDVMKVWIKVKKGKIVDCKWQTFGCGSAISSTSMMSTMVTENGGMSLDDAMKLTAMDINRQLGGLPTIKIHCSILGDQALKAAIKDYLNKKK